MAMGLPGVHEADVVPAPVKLPPNGGTGSSNRQRITTFQKEGRQSAVMRGGSRTGDRSLDG